MSGARAGVRNEFAPYGLERMGYAAPKTTRAGAIGQCGRVCFMAAMSVGPLAVLCRCQKAAAWGRVVFGAAGLRPLIPRRYGARTISNVTANAALAS